MTTGLNKFKKPLLFVLAIVPIAIVGGYFTGIYGWAELTDDVKSQILAQIGNNQNLYYLITTVQALIYALIFGFFGCILSEKTGLMKPVRFEKKPIMVTIGMTLFTGLVLCTDLFYFRKHIPQVAAIYQGKPSFAYWMASVLYGGVIEEVMLRLFMMSLLAFLAWKLFFRREAKPPTGVIIAANIMAALLFAAGHLPSTMQMFGEITPLILQRCFLLNGVGGLVFGYLYRKYGIQYSMMAHAGAHIVWKIIWILFL
ncbi:MAG: CPBP family intramembrane metalloprotease [Oscillospiraceae bacterium]|nr:CPBP family intramembrane metalloprotease [Oscillospiraceae bacterium]